MRRVGRACVNESDAPDLIGDQTIGRTALQHEVGYAGMRTVEFPDGWTRQNPGREDGRRTTATALGACAPKYDDEWRALLRCPPSAGVVPDAAGATSALACFAVTRSPSRFPRSADRRLRRLTRRLARSGPRVRGRTRN